MGQLSRVIYAMGLADWVKISLAARDIEVVEVVSTDNLPPLSIVPVCVTGDKCGDWMMVAEDYAAKNSGRYPRARFLAKSAVDMVPSPYSKYFAYGLRDWAYDVEELADLSRLKEGLQFARELLTPHPPLTLGQVKQAFGLG